MYIESWLKPIFHLFLTWLFCKLRFLTPVDDIPPTPSPSPVLLVKLHLCLRSILIFPPICASVFMCSPIFRCSNQNLHAYLTSLLCTAHTACHILIPFGDPNNLWWMVQIMKHLIMQFSLASCNFLPLRSKCSYQHPILRHPSLFSSLEVMVI